MLRTSLRPLIKNKMRTGIRFSSSDMEEERKKTEEVKKDLNRLPDKDKYWEYNQKLFGLVYDKKPVKVNCKEGKIYMWCSCGKSNSQPFCDGTHRLKYEKTSLKPVPFKCPETKSYWFCNCKQTKMRPFCDGTHKDECVQSANAVIKF